MKKIFLEEKLPAAYASLESILKSNKGGDGFLVGDGVSTQHIRLIIGGRLNYCYWLRAVFIVATEHTTLRRTVISTNSHLTTHDTSSTLHLICKNTSSIDFNSHCLNIH